MLNKTTCLQYTTEEKLPHVSQQSCKPSLPANGRLAVSWALSCRQSLPYLCLSKPQGQPTDLEILGKLSDFLQINAFLVAHYLLGFCKC